MSRLATSPTLLSPDVCERALDARDARFDGIFFVGITTTRIYCRPVCPARVSYHDRRRFFDTAASAERAGFRPCLRCRPELAPGRALMDAVPNLARVAAHRIAAGGLNGRGVAQLAHDLGVSDRHLRRALERELGVSPLELAQTHRLLLAKRLLADTTLPVTRIAYASGFQSLRRFNSVFRERYRLSPSALRRRPRGELEPASPAAPSGDLVPLTLAYRAPLAWDALAGLLGRGAIPGVELVDGDRYLRTVQLEGRSGIVVVERPAGGTAAHLPVRISSSLLPALMPLLARLRRLLDLDAEPAVVDAQLEHGGLRAQVRRRPGLRILSTLDGFEAAFRVVLSRPGRGAPADLVARLVDVLGEPFDTGLPGLRRLVPDAERVAQAGPDALAALGLPPRSAVALAAVARACLKGTLRLEAGADVAAAHRELRRLAGMDDRLGAAVVALALQWPDAFPAWSRSLQRGAGAASARELRARAERWRPWRAYAALHLRLDADPACLPWSW